MLSYLDNLIEEAKEKDVMRSAIKSQLAQSHSIVDYKQGYTCKHFRNRIIRLQNLCQVHELDAIVVILGVDSRYDSEMNSLQNWLLYGASTYMVHGSSPDLDFQDSFFVISKDSLQAYTNSKGFKKLGELTTLVPNVNLHTITRSEEEDDHEKLEVIKMTKFYEMVHDKKSIGMPVRQISPDDKKFSKESQIVEQWPLIQAYGLDMVGNGFFTMKHRFTCIRDKLWELYSDFDSFTIHKMLFDDMIRLNQTYYDNFFGLNRWSQERRMTFTEKDIYNGFQLDAQFGKLRRKTTTKLEESENDLKLTMKARALIGPKRTNSSYEVESDVETPLSMVSIDKQKEGKEYNQFDNLHFTLEWTDINTGMRFARTMFLCSLVSDNYMKDVHFTQEEADRVPNNYGKDNQKNARILFDAYTALIRAHRSIAQAMLLNEATPQEVQNSGAATALEDELKKIGGSISAQNFPKGIKAHLQTDIHQYDAYGRVQPEIEGNKSNKLLMFRMQLMHINGHDNQDIGSVVYAESFFWIESKTHVCVTKNIPCTQFFSTSEKHYQYTPLPIVVDDKERPMNCDLLGSRIKDGKNTYKSLVGLVPLTPQLSDVMEDTLITGTLSFFEKGFIFADQRLGAFVVPYEDLNAIVFFLDSDSTKSVRNLWIQFQLKTADRIPCARTIDKDNVCFYLRVPYAFVKDKYATFQEAFGEQDVTTTEEAKEQSSKGTQNIVRKVSEACTRCEESFTMKNHTTNSESYDASHGSEFANPAFDRQLHEIIMEYHTVQEFNQLKGKASDLVSFASFRDLFLQNAIKPTAKDIANYLPNLVEKLKRKESAPVNVILVSGIPGSGKGRLADSLARHLQQEKVNAYAFKMPTVQLSVKYNTDVFVENLVQFIADTEKTAKADDGPIDCVVAVLPAYHHLKKAIFELRKHEAFASKQEPKLSHKFVITKVSARNFYMNKNRNFYQFLIENCLRGVSNAIVFERGIVMPETEIRIMQNVLDLANGSKGVLGTQGRVFALDELAKILMSQSEKLNLLYTKYFYGFEKEGKSAYYFEKAVAGHYFNYRVAIQESHLGATIMKLLNEPVTEAETARLRPEAETDRVEREAKAAQALIDEEERMLAMTPLQKRRALAAKRKAERVEEDTVGERLLKEAMESTRAKVTGRALVFERLRGLVTLEEDADQDYQLTINFSEVALKPLKNSANRLSPDQLGFMAYGKGALAEDNERLLREVLKLCRTQIAGKRRLLTADDLTEQELQQIQIDNRAKDLPGGWYYTGSGYIDVMGVSMEEHPDTEKLVKHYLAAKNEKIGEYNRELVRQRREEAKLFVTDSPQVQGEMIEEK